MAGCGQRVAVLVSAAALVQCALGQSAYIPQYQGMQPELVRGVEAGPASGPPLVRHVYAAAPDVLGIVIDAQRIHSLPLVKYEKREGDEIRRARPQHYGTEGRAFYWGRTLIRDGVALGDVVGPNEDHYIPPHRLLGEPLDLSWASEKANFVLLPANAPDQQIHPTAIYRKTRPEGYEWTDAGEQQGSTRHELFLKLPQPLIPGTEYRVNLLNSAQFPEPLVFLFDDTRLRTEAIQVNQVGYHPRQAERSARLSMWLGDGGGVDFSQFQQFSVVEDQSGRVVFSGTIELAQEAKPQKKMAPERTDDPLPELPLSVYRLDFTPFNETGVYRIVIPGLGSSFPFRIDERVWLDAALVSAHGYLNQRSGIALGPPYTKYERPRNFHPDDGFPVRRTDPAIFYDPELFPNPRDGNAFKRIQASILEHTTVPAAWGGWHDAADYDRSILPQNHMRPVHAMLDLYMANPAFFGKLHLNLPESGNGIPDLLNEALWCTDLFLRIQQEDGGIPSAIESIEHPSEPSYLLAQPTAITPPTPQTCHIYAAAAAQMSIALRPFDAQRSQAYRESALRAMEWADRNPQVPNIYARDINPEEIHANLATVWIYRMTGEEQWHQRVKSTFEKAYPDGRLRIGDINYSGPWGIAAYALIEDELADPALRERCRAAVLAAADTKVRQMGESAYHLRPQRYHWDERLGQPWELVIAHQLTGDARYVRAIEQMAQYALGMNPLNASFTTGLGSRQVVPFNLESRYLGAPYPEGITPYGPAPRNIWGGEKMEPHLHRVGLHPEWEHWPWSESFFNIRLANISEYTVGSMANPLMMRAYLAQHFARPAGD